MIKRTDRKVNRLKRHKRVRVSVSGTPERPRRLSSAASTTLRAAHRRWRRPHARAASTVELKSKKNGMEEAAKVGKAIAAKAKAPRCVTLGGLRPRRIPLPRQNQKLLADAAREAGLEF